jgi:hypothetical protein
MGVFPVKTVCANLLQQSPTFTNRDVGPTDGGGATVDAA